MEKVSVKTGSQRRKLKGKKIQWNLLMQGDMQMYTEMQRWCFTLGFFSIPDHISHRQIQLLKLVGEQCLFLYIYSCSENNIRHMESREKKVKSFLQLCRKNHTSFSGKVLFTFPLLSMKEKLNCTVFNNLQANSFIDNSDKVTDLYSSPSGQVKFHH